MLFGAIRLLEYILLIMEQIAWVSRSFIQKKIYCPFFFASLTELITVQRLHNYVDRIQSMNGIVCWYNLLCFENNMKKRDLMILDDSGIDYSRMLLFVLGFLVYLKIEPNSRASGNTWFATWLQTGHVNCQSCQKNKMWRQIQEFLRFY